MFRHKGHRRTFIHNLYLAIVLSFIAGMVSLSAFMAINIGTSSITGHIAGFIKNLGTESIGRALSQLFWLLMFFTGAFTSSMLIDRVGIKSSRYSHTVPIIIEIILLMTVAIFGKNILNFSLGRQLIAGAMLYAMGLQNAMVTRVSDSVVRTTHLTGMLTDLGIETANLLQSKRHDRPDLWKRIKLHGFIILFFMAGGFLAVLIFKYLQLATLILPSILLLCAMIYDSSRLQVYKVSRYIRKKDVEVNLQD